MSVRPTAFIRDGDVPYQSISIIMKVGETRFIPGTLRYIQLRAATTINALAISFNGSSFYNLPLGEQLNDFEADGVWIQNTDVAPNAVTLVTGMASLNSTHVIIDSAGTLSVTVVGTSPISSVDLGTRADTAATTDAGTFSLIALFKRLLGKIDDLIKTVYTVNSLATTNGALIAAGVRRVYSVSMFNASAAVKYVRLYNKATAPTVGTDVAFRVFAIPAGLSLNVATPAGDNFSLGLGIAITNLAPATDATAVAGGDVQLSLNYV